MEVARTPETLAPSPVYSLMEDVWRTWMGYGTKADPTLEIYDPGELLKIYGEEFTALGITPGELVGKSGASFNQDQRERWFAGQILTALTKEDHQLLDNVFHVEPDGNDWHFYFDKPVYRGRDIGALVKMAEKKATAFESNYKRDYGVERGWLNPDDGPGKLIWNGFDWGSDRSTFVGKRMAFLVKPEHPDNIPTIIEGELASTYKTAKGEWSEVAFSVITKDSRVVYGNMNDVRSVRVEDDLLNPFHSVISRLEKQGYTRFSGFGEISSGSDVVWVYPDKDAKKFRPLHQYMKETRKFGVGAVARFTVAKDWPDMKEETEWNINDVTRFSSSHGLLWVKPPGQVK